MTSEARESSQEKPEAPAQEGRLTIGRALKLAWRKVAAREQTLWVVLILLGLLARIWQIMFYRGPMDHIFSDAGRHLDNGRNFMNPGPMGCSNAYFYQLFLYVVIKLTHEQRVWMHVVNAALCVLHPLVWYGFARTVLSRRVYALRFAALLTFLPTHAVIYQYFMNETVILPLVGGALWASSSAAKRRSAWRFLLAALLWTCAILTRSVTLPLATVVFAYSLYHQRARPLVWRPLLGLVGAAITAGGLWIAAQHSLRIFEYATPFGDNTWTPIGWVANTKEYKVSFIKPKHYKYTYVYSSPSLYISPFDPFYEWKSVRKGTFAFSTNVETKGKDLKEMFWKQLKLHRAELPRMIFENLIFLTFGHAWPESGKGDWVGKTCLQERWLWAPTLLVTMIWSLRFMYRRRAIYLVPTIAVFSAAVLYSLQLVIMEGRYRKPIEPLLFLAIVWLFDARRPRRVV